MPYAWVILFHYCDFFGYFCPIWQMRILANVIFFQNQPKVALGKNPVYTIWFSSLKLNNLFFLKMTATVL
jgi:hypothetical protein